MRGSGLFEAGADDHRVSVAGARVRDIGSYGTHQLPGIWKFLTALDADLVCALLDGDDATQFMVTSKRKIGDPMQKSHKSSARCRRSQLPLASSHSSSERTLARASAIEQSAAP